MMGFQRKVARAAKDDFANSSVTMQMSKPFAHESNESKIIYAVDMKLAHEGDAFNHISAMDVSCLNILSFSCSYLPISSQLKYSPHQTSPSLHQNTKSSFCVYVCALEQPWYVSLISTSTEPIVQLAWSANGTQLLVCNRMGICRLLAMKNGCINTMELLYQYETKEDILSAKYIFPREPIVVDPSRTDSLFYHREMGPSPMLQNALKAGNFVCVTTSGTVHTLPRDSAVSACRHCLYSNELLSLSIGGIYPTNEGFNLLLSEDIPGALVHFFAVQYTAFEPKVSYSSHRLHGFRIPSCYGKLQSLVYFQRRGIDCVLTHLKSFSGDLIDLYEYNPTQKEWILTTLLQSPQARITSISSSPCQLFSEDNRYQGLFGRQVLLALSDGSMVRMDKWHVKSPERFFSMNDGNTSVTSPVFLAQIQHTHSGSCCVGFTSNGSLVLLRAVDRKDLGSPTLNMLVHLFEQYIVQVPCPCDIWDVLSLVPKNAMINELIDRLVANYESQSLELKRTYFTRFKVCLFHLHRLISPFIQDSGEHLTSLLVYHTLLVVRDYLRLFIYEPTNRNFADAAQEILHQSLFMQKIDTQRIKYLGDQTETDQYQLISFTLLVNWTTDIIVYLIGYLQSQRIPPWLTCQHLFNDSTQLQWLRELMIYFYILNKVNRIPCSRIAQLQLLAQQRTTQLPEPKDILRNMYHSLTKYSHVLEAQQTTLSDEHCLDDFSIFDIEMLQSKVDSMFPKPSAFLIPNAPSPQLFCRDQPPTFVTDQFGGSIASDRFTDTQFDIITLGKMSLTSNLTFRRCLRCSNFSRSFSVQPSPFLAARLENRCICGGLFLLYTQTTPCGITPTNTVP